jgi:tRNA threonylcarbamoyladenosine biosynthesis protein TsaB
MLLLALDTATEQGSLALLEDGQVAGELSLAAAGSYLRHLLPAAEDLLARRGKSLTHLNALAVSRGPGNFTGLRIGLATVQGLALALNLPVAAISTLSVLAAQFPWRSEPVGVLMDAKRQEVYFAGFRCPGLTPEPLGEPERLPAGQVAQRLLPPMLLTGPGLTAYEEVLGPRLASGVLLAPPEMRHPRAATLGRLALTLLAQGKSVPPAGLTPAYLRPAL